MVKSSAVKEDCQFSGLIDLAEYSLVVDGQIIHFFHKLRIDASWPSEPSLRLSLSINMDGVFSVPGEYLLGLGSQLGVQQSIICSCLGLFCQKTACDHILNLHILTKMAIVVSLSNSRLKAWNHLKMLEM